MPKYKEAILNHIADHQPISRRTVIQHYHHLSSKTVYKHIADLIKENKVYEDENRLLSAASSNKFHLHPLLENHRNATTISNAYFQEDPFLKEKVMEAVAEYGAEMAEMLYDLTILFNLVSNNQVEARDEVVPINKKLLIADLEKLISKFKKPVKQA